MSKLLDHFVEGDDKPIEVDIECHHDIHFADCIEATNLPANSVDLIVTSPPYFNVKDYGNPNQIGYPDDIDHFIHELMARLDTCIRALKPDRRICINTGDVFVKSTKKTPYHVIPIHALIITKLLETRDDVIYLDKIIWKKITTSNTSGGGRVMGSVYYPRNGLFFINREYILIFKKVGKCKETINPCFKLASRLTKKERRTYFKDEWNVKPERQDVHVAMFPPEIPARLVKMFSFVGDTVLDPFLGSGTTVLACSELGRNSIGFEIGFVPPDGRGFKNVIKQKIEVKKCSFARKHGDGGILVNVKNSYEYLGRNKDASEKERCKVTKVDP